MERELNEGKDRREEAEQYARRLERELEDAQKDTELREIRAAAKETAKWEEREARLVQQVAELKQGAVRDAEWGAGRVVSQTAEQVEREDTGNTEESVRQPAAQEEPGYLRYAGVSMPVGGGQEMAGQIEEGANCLTECEAPASASQQLVRGMLACRQGVQTA